MKRRTPKNRAHFSRCAISIVLCCLLLLSGFPMSVTADLAESKQTLTASTTTQIPDRAPGELLVSFPEEVSVSHAQEILTSILGEVGTFEILFECREKRSDSCIIYLVSVLPDYESSIINALTAQESVLYVEPNYTIEAESSSTEVIAALVELSTTRTSSPYDPYEQWALDMIGVADAWGSGFTGSANIKVGVIDTGIAIHSDLEENVNRTLGCNIITPIDTELTDPHGHGTMVAGIIGALKNDEGVVGVCQNITIVPIKIAGNSYGIDSTAYTSEVILAVSHAISQDIDILNFSSKLPSSDRTLNLYAALNYYGGLFVTSAGNFGIDMENDNTAAAKRNNEPTWIVVGNSTSADQVASGSNFSAIYCDLFAPGENVYTTRADGTIDTTSGTSFATPYVTAAAALIMSHATHLTPLEVKELLMTSVDTSTAFEGKCVSGGRLSIINAVNLLYEENRGAYTLGDVDGDGYINATDLQIAQQIIRQTLSPTILQTTALDVNKDGQRNAIDYMLMSRYVNKLFYFPPI